MDKKAEITIISGIEAKASVAAVTDGEHTQAMIEGRADDVMNLLEVVMTSIVESVHDNSKKDSRIQKMAEIEDMLKNFSNSVIRRFLMKKIEEDAGELLEALAKGMDETDDEDEEGDE